MMDQYIDIVDFVRNIKGAGASILWILFLADSPLNNQELERATGYSNKPLADALAWLEPRGYVKYNGRRHGWSLGASFQQLAPQRDGNSRPFSMTANYPNSISHSSDLHGKNSIDRKISTNGRNSINGNISHQLTRNNVDLLFVDPDPEMDIDKQPTNNTNNCLNPELTAVLERVGISGRALNQLGSRDDLETAAVQAWYWYALTQTWVENPQGFTICRLKAGDNPPEGFLGLARAWPGVNQEEKETLFLAATGDDGGLRLHGPAESARDLRYWLEDEPAAEWETAVLEAYLSLARYAPEELKNVS